MAVFVGDVHSSVLGLSDAQGIYEAHGTYEGQSAELHTQSKSMLELAYEMDDCPTDARINRDRLIKRDIKDKKKANAKRDILKFFVNKLDRNRSTQQYTDYEKKLNRLKQQVILQNQQKSRGDGNKLTFDGEPLDEYILRDIPSQFDEVTEQDNALAYLLELEDFETASNEDEIAQCEKMLLRLEGSTDDKSLQRREEFISKVRSLREQIEFSGIYKEALQEAIQLLRKIHGQEIEDGYNLIPKAAGLMNGDVMIGGRQMSSVDIAALYRDKILCCDNFFEAFSVIMMIAGIDAGGSSK